jgi:nucleotide-binding universal stress UspA family protein
MESGADLIVVGSEGLTGVPGFLLGSVARDVAHHAERPVLVARAPQHGVRAVIVAVDASDHAVSAVEFACRLPLPAEAEFLVTHVLHPRDALREQSWEDAELEALATRLRQRRHDEAAVLLGAAMARLEAAGKRPVMAIREGSPAPEILKLAEERRVDLIVAGARGMSGFRRLVVGSVADRLLKFAHCSVLIVP